MTDAAKRFYQTTAIDYPNSRPHIGTAFEKLGADVQARYRRMQGFRVHFLMGNDENTVKVSSRAAELGLDPKAYCDDMAGQFQEVWKSLDVSCDDFIQTSEERHHKGCVQFIQKVYDAGYIYKGTYEGWYCDGCESFKTETEVKEAGGACPVHRTPVVRRSEPCHFFAFSRFQDRLLRFYEENPEFIQPESRRNEVIAFVKAGLQDVNITRHGQTWGIRVPFDPAFTIWVWFDALLNYITAIGYGTDEERYRTWWPADIHFIGKDITRFHCALWPAMLIAAREPPPKKVFGHGFITVDGVKMSKTLGNIIEPGQLMDEMKCTADAVRYYFLRECPFPGDGDFSRQQFRARYVADLQKNLGNVFSRVAGLITQKYGSVLEGTAGSAPGEISEEVDLQTTVRQVREHVEACQYHTALERVWRQILDPVNRHLERTQPWALVKTDREAAKKVLFDGSEVLRVVAILLKPFLPRSAETIYRAFNFPKPWESVRYEDACVHAAPGQDLRVVAELEGNKVKPLFPPLS